MSGNSIIPSAAAHDRHYGHECIVCQAEFTRQWRPAGEVRFCGTWGDACEDCYPDYRPDDDPETELKRQAAAAHLSLAHLHNKLLATVV